MTLADVCVVDHEQALVGPLLVPDYVALSLAVSQPEVRSLLHLVPEAEDVLVAMNGLSDSLPDVPPVVPPQVLLATVQAAAGAIDVLVVSYFFLLLVVLQADVAVHVALNDFYLSVHWRLLFFCLSFCSWSTAVC